jgi:predicted nucleic-acid-binding Zn-ribbon protein
MIIICNKCKSNNVKDVTLDLPAETTITINDFVREGGFNSLSATNTGSRSYQHRITCLDCGYSLTYTNSTA